MSLWNWIAELCALSVFFAFLIFAHHFFFSVSSHHPSKLYSNTSTPPPPPPPPCRVAFYIDLGFKANVESEKSCQVRNFPEQKKKSLNSPLKYNIHGYFFMHIWGWYTIQLSQFFLQRWNRLLFSQLNTWWSSWLTLRGHVVQKKKKCIFKHLNHTQPGEMLILCERFRNWDQLKEHPIHISFPALLWGICARGTWDRITHTIYILFFLSFSFCQS